MLNAVVIIIRMKKRQQLVLSQKWLRLMQVTVSCVIVLSVSILIVLMQSRHRLFFR